ncbi:hypothetical protein, partial [Staphylococcus epidermidis]|uniref:hypothetical protein n=7 Tax=Staphylococcus epidermidis TaxID=1282 RepID=UPI00066D036A
YRKRTVIWPFYFYTIIRTLSFVFSLFFVKDYMKTNYSFLMAADFKKSIKQNNMFSKYSNDILKDISSCIVDNDFKVSGRLEKLKKSQNSIYKKRNVTKVYELISFISWFALPLLMSQVYVGIFTAYKGIELFIMLLITLIAFVLANSLAVYFDLKLQRGDVSATDKMIKTHIEQYEKLLNKEKKEDAERKNSEH